MTKKFNIKWKMERNSNHIYRTVLPIGSQFQESSLVASGDVSHTCLFFIPQNRVMWLVSGNNKYMNSSLNKLTWNFLNKSCLIRREKTFYTNFEISL